MVGAAGDIQSIQVNAKQSFNATADDKPKKVNEKTPTSQEPYKELTPSDRREIEAIDGVEKALPVFGVDMQSVAANGSDQYEGKMEVQYDGTTIDLSAGKLAGDNEILPGQVVLPYKYVESFGFKNAQAALGEQSPRPCRRR